MKNQSEKISQKILPNISRALIMSIFLLILSIAIAIGSGNGAGYGTEQCRTEHRISGPRSLRDILTGAVQTAASHSGSRAFSIKFSCKSPQNCSGSSLPDSFF